MRFFLTLLLLTIFTTPLYAKPKVVTDIAPVHSLVAQVMAGVETPFLLVDANSSPHDFALRPKQAQALQQADLVFWIGPALTPWLEKPLATLGAKARVVTLQETPGLQHWPLRFGDAQDRGTMDPHLWLSPDNALIWIDYIANQLARVDPENTLKYLLNANTARAGVAATLAHINGKMAGLPERPFLLFHDSYQYFERNFGLQAKGAISLGDGAPLGAARIATAREIMRDQQIVCVFHEPQSSPRMVQTVTEGFTARTMELDSLGQDLPIGKNLYASLMRKLAYSYVECLH